MALRAVVRPRGREPAGCGLFAIARNAVIDEARRAKVRPWRATTAVEPDTHAPYVVRVDDHVLDSWVVEEALRRISVEHRSVIVQVYLRGRPAGEVAAEQGGCRSGRYAVGCFTG